MINWIFGIGEVIIIVLTYIYLTYMMVRHDRWGYNPPISRLLISCGWPLVLLIEIVCLINNLLLKIDKMFIKK